VAPPEAGQHGPGRRNEITAYLVHPGGEPERLERRHEYLGGQVFRARSVTDLSVDQAVDPGHVVSIDVLPVRVGVCGIERFARHRVAATGILTRRSLPDRYGDQSRGLRVVSRSMCPLAREPRCCPARAASVLSPKSKYTRLSAG
jgi:hypothetical protein